MQITQYTRNVQRVLQVDKIVMLLMCVHTHVKKRVHPFFKFFYVPGHNKTIILSSPGFSVK